MTVIKLDAATLAKFRSAEGRVLLADESGKPVAICVLPPILTAEPTLTTDEWERRMNPEGGMTTHQMLEFLQGLSNQ